MPGALGSAAIGIGGSILADELQDDGSPQQVVDTTPSEFQALRAPTSNSLQNIIGSIQGSGRFDPNQADLSRLSAPLSGTEQGLVDRIGGLAGGPTALQDQGRGLLSQTLSGQFTDPASNPFLQSTLDTATRRINEQNQTNNSALIGQFKRAGATLRSDPNRVGSSAFLNQARLGERDRLNAIGDVTGNILSQNFQQERNRQQQGIQQAEQISTQDIGNAIEGLKATALPRLIEDLGIQRGIAEFNERISRLLQTLQLSGGLASGGSTTLDAVAPSDTAASSLVRGIGGFASSGGSQQGLNLLNQNELRPQFG